MTVLTDTQVVTASGGLVELGYVERTTTQSVTATTFAGASEVFATDLTFVADGSPVLVEFSCPAVSVGGTYIIMNLSNGSTGDMGQIVYAASNSTANTEYRYTPSAGVQTLNVRAWVQSGTGYVYGGAGGSGQYPPILLRVSKIVQATQWPAATTGTIICTSSTRPASPFVGQQIYETDTKRTLTYDGASWCRFNQVLGFHELNTAFNTSATHTTLQDEGLSCSVTYGGNRYLRVSAKLILYTPGGVNAIRTAFLRGATTIFQHEAQATLLQNSDGSSFNPSSVFSTPSTGATETFKVQIRALVNNTQVSSYADATFSRQLLVEDIGPA